MVLEELLAVMSGKFLKLDFDTFMNVSIRIAASAVTPPPPETWKGKFDTITDDTTEAELQTEFINVINELELLAPRFKMVSPDRADKMGASRQKADDGVYATSETPDDNQTCWETKALLLEFKKEVTEDDPFNDRGRRSFEAKSTQRRKNRGQIIHYASEVFLHQHRCFLFSIIVLGTSARILRWDRSGTIVTEKFDYCDHPEKICGFLWLFARLSPEDQGYDTTAVRVDKGSEEYDLMNKLFKPPQDAHKNPFDYIRDYFRMSLASGSIRYKMTVVDEGESDDDSQDAGDSDNGATGDTVANDPGAGEGSKASSTPNNKKVFQFLICKPHFSAPGVLGRGTRGYVAINVATQKFVFLKDAWRVKLPGIQREGDVLRFLNAKGVQNIPTVLCHSDINGQCTLSQDYPEWLGHDHRIQLKEHSHYRIAEFEVGQKLETFEGGNVLLKIMWDCLTAHEDAYVKAGILHRYISEGNILIFQRQHSNGEIEPCGLLNDWEISKKIPNIDAPQDEASPGCQPDRMGTWPFLSAMSLINKHKKIVLQDDLESFFHVLLYMAIKFIPSNCDDIGSFIERFFEAAIRHKGEYVCGSDKMNAMQNGRITVRISGAGYAMTVPLKFVESEVEYPMNELIDILLQWFSAYYREEQARHMSQANSAGSSRKPSPTPSIMPTAYLSMFDGLPLPSEADLASLICTLQVLPGRDAELAANLSSHEKIRNLFLGFTQCLDNWPLPDTGKMDDHRPELNYRCKQTFESNSDLEANLPQRKRTKLSHTASDADFVEPIAPVRSSVVR
ncbi:hypothetical protein B0H21DRAFT_864972 [Amylocystis lapponica]|nr:hypothetical protein B0H21DRAFT_864972 [Amylocystis lapponica]